MKTNDKDKKKDVAEAPTQVITHPKKRRQIVIETDGSSIHLVSADVAGQIELVAILQNLLSFLNKPNANKISPGENK
jgi:hypothetical protein